MPLITKALTRYDLPAPPPDKVGFPWTEQSELMGDCMPDGSEYPRISIVTPSYNQGQFIEETIRSVLLQGYPNLEYIIMDGGSTDHTLEIIKKYEPWLTYWESQSDRGQAHAINKGLRRVTGSVFNWLNSDDLLTPGALAKIANHFGEADLLAGSCRNFYMDNDHQEIIRNQNIDIKGFIGQHPQIYHQPGVWLKPHLIEKCGGIDENLHYCFDGDLMMRYIFFQGKVQYIPDILVSFRFHQDSKTFFCRNQKNLFYKDYIYSLNKLLNLEEFKPIHAYCQRRLRQLAWIEELNEIRTKQTSSRRSRRWKIISLMFADPTIRLSRMTLGALRRV
jgi:glycosyltransferase involved in cell wall biosynthesis